MKERLSFRLEDWDKGYMSFSNPKMPMGTAGMRNCMSISCAGICIEGGGDLIITKVQVEKDGLQKSDTTPMDEYLAAYSSYIDNI
jgi:hypothetical protein